MKSGGDLPENTVGSLSGRKSRAKYRDIREHGQVSVHQRSLNSFSISGHIRGVEEQDHGGSDTYKLKEDMSHLSRHFVSIVRDVLICLNPDCFPSIAILSL